MGEYSKQYMETNFAVGYTAPEYGRGRAWHQDENSPLAFPHSIPMETIDEMIGWEPVQVPMLYADPETGEIKVYEGPQIVLGGKPGELRPVGKNDGASNLFSFRQWFVKNLAEILDVNSGDLGVGFLGIFKNGASAAMQIELAETIVNGFTGVAYRSHIYAATSIDGSMRPQYGAGTQIMVCDNTFRAGQLEAMRSGMFYSLKQTAHATLDILAARDALQIVHSNADAVGQELEMMAQTPVTDAQWFAFLDEWAPVPEKDPKVKSGGRGYTIAAKKRDEMEHLYNFDNRVAPWAGTKFGVSQAVTTWSQHFQTVKNASRLERNRLNAVTGKSTEIETDAMRKLDLILANA